MQQNELNNLDFTKHIGKIENPTLLQNFFKKPVCENQLGIKSDLKEVKDILNDSFSLASKLKEDVKFLYNLLEDLGIKKFNKQSKYKWDFLGIYSYSPSIYTKTRFHKKIIIEDIKYVKYFYKFIEEENTIIFDIINEVVDWIQGEIENMKHSVDMFSELYSNSSERIKTTIEAYNSLKKELNN